MSKSALEKPHLGKLGLAFFFLIIALGLGFQTFIELVAMGLGSGVAPATNALASVPMAVVPTLLFLFFGLISFKGFRLTFKTLAYAVSLHGLLCGWLWIFLSTPMKTAYGSWWSAWLDNHPDLAGLWLMLASGAVWLALFATSPALPPELKRLRGFP